MALVLTRGPLEQLRFVPAGGPEILITFADLGPRRVSVIVEAPADVMIQCPESDRWSLTDAAQAEAEACYRQQLQWATRPEEPLL
jgi:hypothetical protein